MARIVREEAGLAGVMARRQGAALSPFVWELALYSLILLAATGLRFWDLGSRALHHDESLHATFSWYLASGRGYHHDPLMHGPFQFHASALVFKLFGDSDYTARVAAAVFGTALVIMPYFLRDRLGRIGALVASFFIALSPTLLYFSRFTREDIYFAVFTFGLVIALVKYLDTRRDPWLYIAAVMLALSFATKEVAYMTVALVLLYLDILVGVELWQRWYAAGTRGYLASVLALPVFIASAWLLVILWPFSTAVRRRFPQEALPASAESLLVIGTLTAPQCAAAIQIVFSALHLPFKQGEASLFGYDFRGDGSLALLSVLTLLGASAYIGTAWDPKRWVFAAAAFYLPYALLFTTFFANPAGFGSGIWGSLDYWLAQHDVRRGEQPAYYYAMLLPVYEFLPLLLALAGGLFLVMRGDRFSRFLVFWAAAMFVALSWAGEKMPWLNVHLALPLALVAAKGVDEWSHRFPGWRLSRTSVVTTTTASLLALTLVALTVWSGLRLTFVHADTPVELLIYTQTAPDIPRLVERIEQVAHETEAGYDLPVVVDSTDSFAWPWAWYLRHYRQASFPTITPDSEPPAGAVVLLNYGNASVLAPYQGLYAPGIPYRHRWWFPEVYRGVTLESFLVGLFKPQTWKTWGTYFLQRRPPAELGSVDGIAYFPLGTSHADVTAPEVRVSQRQAGPEVVLGRTGIRPGEFLRPTGLTVDAAGNLYVVDSANHRLQKLDNQGNVLAVIGLRGNQLGRFNEPWGAAVDNAGNLYVADTWNHRIQKFDKDLHPLQVWGQAALNMAQPGATEFYGPRAIAIDEAGNLWVTDTGNSRLIKFGPHGEVMAVHGGPGEGPGRFREPVGIALGRDGTVFVADTWNRRIQWFDRDFRYQGELHVAGWGSRDILAKPYLAALPDGRVLFSDPANGRIGIADPQSGAIHLIERLPSGERLNVPIGVAADGQSAYIADARENVIRRLPLNTLLRP